VNQEGFPFNQTVKTQPIQQDYVQPAQPGYVQPVQQVYAQQAQPGYVQPVQQGYAQQAQPGYVQPVYQEGYIYSETYGQQGSYTMPAGPVVYAPLVENPGQSLGVAALILGILSILIPFGGIVFGIVGIPLGAVGRRKSSMVGMPSGMAVGGIVTSVIGIITWLLTTVALVSLMVNVSLAF